jgi:threonine aldolase
MKKSWIDYRSDTVTQPTPAMREAMQNAQVGDDVFGEDPSINEIAIKAHTQPGDEVICDENSHIYQYEGGGIAFNAGCSVKLLPGDRGRITASQVRDAIQPDDVHRPISRLVSLENTCNRGGGSCYNFQDIEDIKTVCSEQGLALHLDGARIWNAMVAKNERPQQYGQTFDSISVCLSKSLGCPVGSVLVGKKDFIKKARRIRKVFGGGMRQAGFIAAAGIYALDHHIDRLQTDHAHALLLAEALAGKSFVKFILPVETNIVIFELEESLTAPSFVASLKEQGILGYAIAPQRVRLVTHLDISPLMIEQTIDTFNKI